MVNAPIALTYGVWTRARRAGEVLCRALVSAGLVATAACSPSKLVDTQSPSTVADPSLVETATGAAGLRIEALQQTFSAVAFGGSSDVMTQSGMITDELRGWYYGGYYNPSASGDDRHTLSLTKDVNVSGYGYGDLQRARTETRYAQQALGLYGGTASVPRAWEGEMYALEGYTVIWLAELYCSGIPLSKASLKGEQIMEKGSSTQEMFTAAIALFDSALVAGADSAKFVNLARVGKARALLGLGQFDAADSVARDVPTDFLYTLAPSLSGGVRFGMAAIFEPAGAYRVDDHEGGNGLVWSTDPRTGITTVPDQTGAMLWPAKYNLNPTTGAPDPLTPRTNVLFRLADGLEARLIQAEAALKRSDASWLTTLNMLRATCIGTAVCAPIPGIASNALPALTDPGTPAARLDTLMKERAMWLYLTGHREGDLRRLAHYYGRAINTLWPTGTISEPPYGDMFQTPGPLNGVPYGSDVVYAPSASERANNPLYGGCYDTNP